MLKKELLDILCCPACRGGLKYDPQKETLTCLSCGHVYRVKDGIPVMLAEAEPPKAKP